MLDVKGRWALVTGAARGIGYGAAMSLAKQGCNLIVQARSLENCNKVVEDAKALGVEAVAVAAEFSDLSQVEQMLKTIDEMGKDIDIVLNNAGIQIAYRNVYLDTPVSDYEESFKINTIAPMMIVYHFLPKMEKRAFGRIVNTTSGIRLEPEQAGYSASKAALDKVTMDLAAKYEGTDICINLTDPGWCRTDLGGPNAPNSPESAIPGVVVGAFIENRKSGRCFAASDFHGMTLEEAVNKASNDYPVFTGTVAYPE
ncbi:MAG: SDR family oxidoreductase [Lachnospiraceae bacterium]|nr:SDR family oxidoreductase [Lachnospiraceae bacterium]